MELANNLLDDATIGDVVSLIGKNEHVEALLLANNAITDSGAAQLLRALATNRRVRVLDLARNSIEMAPPLRNALAELYLAGGNRTLRTLDFAQ